MCEMSLGVCEMNAVLETIGQCYKAYAQATNATHVNKCESLLDYQLLNGIGWECIMLSLIDFKSEWGGKGQYFFISTFLSSELETQGNIDVKYT